MAPSIYHSLLLPDLQLMLDEQDVSAMREFCDALHPGIAAEVLEGLPSKQTWEVLSHCTPEKQAEIFAFFSLPTQVEMVDSIGPEQLSRIIEEMSADDRVDLLERLDPERVERLLRFVAQAERADIRKLLSYPEGSAGSIMTTDYAWLPSDITAKEAIDRMRVQAPTRETIYYIYVTDESRHLIGFVSLGTLIQAKPGATISDIMQRDVISVRVDDDQEFVANEVLKYGFIAIPVVDNQHRLVGIITHDDAAEVIQEEAAEDAYLAGGMTPLEDSYVETPFFTLAINRGMWLLILLGAATLTAQVLNYFEHQEQMNWMVLFLPMVLASGGNAGSQSATLMIRALALNETEGRVRWIAWREIRIGSLLGLVLAITSTIVACMMVGGRAGGVVGLTVFFVVAAGTFFGAMLPLALKRLGLDPAFMSNPLIASLSDMLGVVIYYNAANYLMNLF